MVADLRQMQPKGKELRQSFNSRSNILQYTKKLLIIVANILDEESK